VIGWLGKLTCPTKKAFRGEMTLFQPTIISSNAAVERADHHQGPARSLNVAEESGRRHVHCSRCVVMTCTAACVNVVRSLGPELNGGEYGVEWLRHAVEVDRVDEQPRVTELAIRARAQEAPQLRFLGPSPPRGLPLHDAERAEIALRAEEPPARHRAAGVTSRPCRHKSGPKRGSGRSRTGSQMGPVDQHL
jgi:hypothetical protein